MSYNHTQIGNLIIGVFVGVGLLFGSILMQAEVKLDLKPIMLVLMAFILFLIASFATLTVVIDDEFLRIKFGYGIFRKRFALSQIESAKAVKNHWYYGWGIRVWFKPLMLIFNVSGFDAVEIVMKNHRIYRIGTDEPDNLQDSIEQAIK